MKYVLWLLRAIGYALLAVIALPFLIYGVMLWFRIRLGALIWLLVERPQRVHEYGNGCHDHT